MIVDSQILKHMDEQFKWVGVLHTCKSFYKKITLHCVQECSEVNLACLWRRRMGYFQSYLEGLS